MKKRIRTRYAPSPTGYLHIGGARTALFNYLFAKHMNGDFVLRIEDTDKSRNVENGEQSQIENLEWLGIIPDESPLKPVEKFGFYRQSEKLKRYNDLIDQLLKSGAAYKAYDTSKEVLQQKSEQVAQCQFSFRYDRNWIKNKVTTEELDKREKEGLFSIRIALKKDHIYKWNDIVRGVIEINTDEVGDWIIQKSDGFPTYNFAVVVDDHDMEITHVLRGEEHTTNTAKQLAVYDAFEWKIPKFGHLTLITNIAGKKLSKRDNTVKQFIADYRREGYVPHAIFNFLALLGWSHPEVKEVLSKDQLIQDFRLERLSKSPSKFDIKKMEWFSKHYMQLVDQNIIKKELNSSKDIAWVKLFIETNLPSVSNIEELKKAHNIYTNENSKIPKLEQGDEVVVKVFKKIISELTFTIDNIQDAIKKTSKKTQIKGKKLFMPLRLIMTHQEHGPELAKAIFLFGKEKIMERLNNDIIF